MDKNLKLLDRYKDIKIIYGVNLHGENEVANPENLKNCMFNLKILKKKSEKSDLHLGLQTSNPEYSPNHLVLVSVFYSKMIKQENDSEIIGFYKKEPAKNLKEKDIMLLSFNDHTRYDEAPFIITSISDQNVEMEALIDCVPYKKVVLSNNDFDRLQEMNEHFKLVKLGDEWFEDELEKLMEEINSD